MGRGGLIQAVRMAAAASLILWAAPATAEKGVTVNRAIPFPKGGRAALKIKAGSLVFNEVIVRNMPNTDDLRQAKFNPRDNCHPKLAVGVTSNAYERRRFHLTVGLEDRQGNVYMSCDRNDSISPGSVNDHTNLCWLNSMKTIDWPKVTVLRVIIEVEPTD